MTCETHAIRNALVLSHILIEVTLPLEDFISSAYKTAARAPKPLYLKCLGALERRNQCICRVWELACAETTIFVVSGRSRAPEPLYLKCLGALERQNHCICRVWELACAETIIFVMSERSRAPARHYGSLRSPQRLASLAPAPRFARPEHLASLGQAKLRWGSSACLSLREAPRSSQMLREQLAC